MEQNEHLHNLALRLTKLESDIHHGRPLPKHRDVMNKEINEEAKRHGLSPNNVLNYSLDNRDKLIIELEKLDPKNTYQTDYSKMYTTGITE